MKTYVFGLSAVICCSTVAVLTIGTQRAEAQSGTRAPKQEAAPFEVRFWNWLSKADYRHWAAPAGEAAEEFYPGKSPHGALIKTHLNRTAASHQKELPVGSVIVKENFNKDKKLMAVTVMYKSKGYDREHKDWWYAKYMPDGKVATMKMKNSDKVMKLAGKAKGCIMCHESADGKDFAFFND